ncbi:MAG: hypothetical protein HYW28_00265 [Rhodospirillales bacterium]|nr:hypothetical protein [Rhodospirillales bacterium]
MMRKLLLPVGLAALLGACENAVRYEAAVRNWEPTYCYQTIGEAACYEAPYHRDERRLVNYFGPHPRRYEKPVPPTPPTPVPPAPINYWVKDPEPIPCPVTPRQMCEFPGFRAPGAGLNGDAAKAGAAATQALPEAPPPSAAPVAPVRLMPPHLLPQP